MATPHENSAPDSPLPAPDANALTVRSSLPRLLRSLLGYGVAIASVAIVAAIQVLILQPSFAAQPSLLLFVLPVLFTGYMGTARQALFATVLGALVCRYYVLEPTYSFELTTADTQLRVLFFLLVGIAVSVLFGRLKAAEAAAREARSRLDAALLGGKVGTWTWTLPDGYLTGDRNVAKLLEISADAAARGTLDDFLGRTHADDIPLLRSHLQETMRTGAEFDVPEARVYARDGSVRWLSARARLELDAEGKPTSLNGIVFDITDRKLVEHELRASEAQMRLITDAMPALIAYVDADERYRFNNKAYEVWYGLKRESLLGRTARDFLGPEGYKTVEPYIRTVLQGKPVTYEGQVAFADGRTRFLKGDYIPHVTSDGTVAGFYALVEDLSAHKAAQSALRASEARFRTMADQAPVLIWISGPDGLCTWFNKPWVDFTGRPIEQELGTGWMQGLHPDDVERISTSDSRANALHEAFVWEYRLRRRDGEYRWLIDHGVPLLGENNRFVGFIGSCIDITERRQMEEALREADRRKDEFLATLAHELRNPLAPIRQAAKVSKSGQATEAQLRWSYDVIDRQVHHMALLLDDLLDVSRITRGTLALRRQPLGIKEVIDSALETARPLIDSRRHRLHVEVPSSTVLLYADPLRLAQVLANLLTNAAKYTEPGGDIRVRAGVTANEAMISVSDTGVGIAPETLPRVFEMFSQVKSTLHQAEGGLGIGLALARGLIDLHGGRLEARSDGVGRGSEFIVHLPVSASLVLPTSPPADLTAPPLSSHRVLIADDNRDAADSLSLLLELEGHEIRTVHDGRAAVSEAERFRPEIALLDIGMPELNGFEVARELRKQPWAQHTLLIAITGWGQEQDRRRSREAGFDHHLTKPIDPDAVSRLIKEGRKSME
jgi:PAS domain S-box-containing protein